MFCSKVVTAFTTESSRSLSDFLFSPLLYQFCYLLLFTSILHLCIMSSIFFYIPFYSFPFLISINYSSSCLVFSLIFFFFSSFLFHVALLHFLCLKPTFIVCCLFVSSSLLWLILFSSIHFIFSE